MGKHLQSLLSTKHGSPCTQYPYVIEIIMDDPEYIVETNGKHLLKQSFFKKLNQLESNSFEGSMITKYSWIFERDIHNVRNFINGGPLSDLITCCILGSFSYGRTLLFNIYALWLLIISRRIILQIIISGLLLSVAEAEAIQLIYSVQGKELILNQGLRQKKGQPFINFVPCL